MPKNAPQRRSLGPLYRAVPCTYQTTRPPPSLQKDGRNVGELTVAVNDVRLKISHCPKAPQSEDTALHEALFVP